jgi:hypothetical protein
MEDPGIGLLERRQEDIVRAIGQAPDGKYRMFAVPAGLGCPDQSK